MKEKTQNIIVGFEVSIAIGFVMFLAIVDAEIISSYFSDIQIALIMLSLVIVLYWTVHTFSK